MEQYNSHGNIKAPIHLEKVNRMPGGTDETNRSAESIDMVKEYHGNSYRKAIMPSRSEV